MLIKITISKTPKLSLNNLNKFLDKLKNVNYLKTVYLQDIELEIDTPRFIRIPSNIPVENIEIQDPWNTLKEIPVSYSNLRSWSIHNSIEEVNIYYNHNSFSYYRSVYNGDKSNNHIHSFLDNSINHLICSRLGKTVMRIENSTNSLCKFYKTDWEF
jgi:hypothetical protein